MNEIELNLPNWWWGMLICAGAKKEFYRTQQCVYCRIKKIISLFKELARPVLLFNNWIEGQNELFYNKVVNKRWTLKNYYRQIAQITNIISLNLFDVQMFSLYLKPWHHIPKLPYFSMRTYNTISINSTLISKYYFQTICIKLE